MIQDQNIEEMKMLNNPTEREGLQTERWWNETIIN